MTVTLWMVSHYVTVSVECVCTQVCIFYSMICLYCVVF